MWPHLKEVHTLNRIKLSTLKLVDGRIVDIEIEYDLRNPPFVNTNIEDHHVVLCGINTPALMHG